jgi:hypothetical protein
MQNATDNERVLVVMDARPRSMSHKLTRWFNAHQQLMPELRLGSYALAHTNEEVEMLSVLLRVNPEESHMLIHNSRVMNTLGTLYGIIEIADEPVGYYRFLYHESKSGFVQQRGLLFLCGAMDQPSLERINDFIAEWVDKTEKELVSAPL